MIKKTMQSFTVNGKKFQAENCVNGVLINPKLPKMFDNTPNEDRPASQAKWEMRPYIVTDSVEDSDLFYAERTDEYAEAGRSMWAARRNKWLEAWPEGVRYDVRCLDFGAWDRSTCWGAYASLDAAIEVIQGSAPRDYRIL